MSQDRRIHTRHKSKLPARLLRGGDLTIEGHIENIGRGGVFFATETLEGVIEDGSPVTIEFEGSRDGAPLPCSIRGAVLRTERYFDGHAVVRAFAVKFESQLELADIGVA